ncbi:regulatory signaling modulator protein AmpE [Legionella sp. W05-934-2]|jgi:AmpE protein|uniref:regulatory signaling modulator protein AmpE n=1 Tax=Legionella sp. W05-934-2 TaxID=1198649 RepID=UPI003461FF29
MKLLVILIALFSERFLMHKLADKRVSWIHWIQKQFIEICNNNKPLQSRLMKTVLMVLPMWLIVAGVYWILSDAFWGIAYFIMNLVIFYFCIGPTNIFYPSEKEGVGIQHLVIANGAIIAPIFWYILLGPLFMLAYRLIELASHHQKEQLYCEVIVQWLDWIPARITSLCYLFVGHFQRGLEPFGHYFFAKPQDNNVLLESSGMAAISDDQSTLSELDAEKALEHSIILYLVFIAIVTIIAWF